MNRTKRSVSRLYAALLCGCALAAAWPAPAHADGGVVLNALPDEIDPQGRYVIYEHGAIAEGINVRPNHPRYGTYLLTGIRNALSDPAWVLISRQRGTDANVNYEAARLTGWVGKLLAAGVPAQNIALVGFSKGGQIVALASGRLAERGVDTVLLASCWNWLARVPALQLGGRVLSIYETSDFAGSCKPLATRGDAVASFEELPLTTGKAHGEFFQPRAEWVEPLRAFLKHEPAASAQPAATVAPKAADAPPGDSPG